MNVFSLKSRKNSRKSVKSLKFSLIWRKKLKILYFDLIFISSQTKKSLSKSEQLLKFLKSWPSSFWIINLLSTHHKGVWYGLSTASLSTDRFIDTQFIDTTFDRQVHFIDMTVLLKLLFLSLFTYRNNTQ
jgi:hypothetical protein